MVAAEPAHKTGIGFKLWTKDWRNNEVAVLAPDDATVALLEESEYALEDDHFATSEAKSAEFRKEYGVSPQEYIDTVNSVFSALQTAFYAALEHTLYFEPHVRTGEVTAEPMKFEGWPTMDAIRSGEWASNQDKPAADERPTSQPPPPSMS